MKILSRTQQLVLRIGNKKFKVKPMFGVKAYLGLMFWRRGNVLLPNGAIHTWFCKPMKLIYMKNNKVIKVINAKPWRTFKKIDAEFIFETTENVNIKPGERVYGLPNVAKRKIGRRDKKRK